MGLTNQQWKRLYNQAIEKHKATAAQLAAAQWLTDVVIEEVSQAMSSGQKLSNYSDLWTPEQIKNCGDVIRNHCEKALVEARKIRDCGKVLFSEEATQ